MPDPIFSGKGEKYYLFWPAELVQRMINVNVILIFHYGGSNKIIEDTKEMTQSRNTAFQRHTKG